MTWREGGDRMRWVAPGIAAAWLLATGGCSNSPAPPGPILPANPNPLSFNPGLTLKWPGAPFESSHVVPTDAGEQKVYNATYTDQRPAGVLVLSATVIEYPERALDGTTAEELVAAYLFGSREGETSRKPVAHGPQKHSGLDVTTRSGNRSGRRLVVMAGR